MDSYIATYNQMLESFPFNATTPNGRGFLPPLVRGMGHLLYLMGRISDSRARSNQGFIETELLATRTHWSSVNRPTTTMSENNLKMFDKLCDMLDQLIASINAYENDEERIEAIRNLVNRTLVFTSILDRELVGLRNSDAGYDI